MWVISDPAAGWWRPVTTWARALALRYFLTPRSPAIIPPRARFVRDGAHGIWISDE